MNAAERVVAGGKGSGFTLIELLAALAIAALLAVMAYRGLTAVQEARAHVSRESEKWLRVAAFLERFERDAQMAAPRPVRRGATVVAPWVGQVSNTSSAVEFSRFSGTAEGPAQRLSYRLNERQEVELLVWPAPDLAAGSAPARHALLAGVSGFELRYYNAVAGWVDTWPPSSLDGGLPRAIRLRLTLAGNEEIVRVFALRS